MFNSTHTLVAVAIARTGADEWVPYAAATAVIASNLPDIEIVTGLLGTPAYLEYHRGITHSLIGVPILALLLAAAVHIFSGKFWKTYLVALIAMATHPALDYMNTYGWRPFLPWSGTWYYGDTLFIIDPYIDLALLVGIVAGQLRPKVRRVIARLSLGIILAYIGVRIELHRMAATKLEAVVRQTPGVEKWAVLPKMFNPLQWEGIIETETSVEKVGVDSLGGLVRAADVTRMDRGPRSAIVSRAANARSAAALLHFARFPVTRLEPMPSGYRVTFLDFRFYSEVTNTALASEVILDQSLHVVKESLSFAKTIH